MLAEHILLCIAVAILFNIHLILAVTLYVISLNPVWLLHSTS